MIRRIGLILAVLALFFGSFWIELIKKYLGGTYFLSADVFLLLGFTLSLAFLFKCSNRRNSFSAKAKFLPSGRRWFLLSVLFLIGLLTVLIAVNRYVLHSFLSSADEHSCYFLAECIRKGRWWVPPHPLADFFEVVHVGNKDGKWFSVYPPGWPLVYALGLQFRIQDFLNPILAVLATPFLYSIGKRFYGRQASVLGLILSASAPFFLLNNASYFSHTLCFFLTVLFIWSYLRFWDGRGWMWAILAALCLGYGLGVRYLTTAAICFPFVAYRLLTLIARKNKFRTGDALFIIVLVFFVILNLLFNYAITGNLFDAPNHYHHRWERLGFHYDYTPLNALTFILSRFFYLMDWAAPILLPLYFISLWRCRHETWLKKLIRFVFLYPVFAYVFYYSWGGNQFGPRYYVEGFPFLALAASDLIVQMMKNSELPMRRFLMGLILGAIVSNIWLFSKHAEFQSLASSQRKALYELVEEKTKKPAVVFISGFLGDALVLSQDDAVRNSPSLDSPVLYAHDRGEKNKLMKEYFGDRQFYRGRYDRSKKEAVLEKLDL